MNEKEEKKKKKRREENIRIKTYSPPAILSFAFMMIRREGKKDQSSREKERSRTRRAKRERTER